MEDYSIWNDMSLVLEGENINIPENLYVFSGHFEGNPILPGIYSLQIAVEYLKMKISKELRLKKVNKCKFHKPVIPGMKMQVVAKYQTYNDKLYKAQVKFIEKDLGVCVVEANFLVEIDE